LSNRARKRKKMKYINSNSLVTIEPIGENQAEVFKAYAEGKNLCLSGSAGTGKTFVLLYLALKDVLSKDTPYEKVVIVRSLLPSREIGYLPGDLSEKSYLYQAPYEMLVKYLFEMPSDQAMSALYDNLVEQDSIEFVSTSFLRGTTFDRCIVICDECQNFTFQELDTITTRIGQDSTIHWAGDEAQTDLRNGQKDGWYNFQKIIGDMDEGVVVEFGIGDIIRSGWVRSYLIAKSKLSFKQDMS